MQSQETIQESTQSITDIKSLRIASNFGATLGVKKLLTTVQVGKPKSRSSSEPISQKTWFFRQ